MFELSAVAICALALALVAALAVLAAWRRVRRMSAVFLGRSLEHERELARACGVDLERFLTLAQRLNWGLLQHDLIKVDLEAVGRQLEREFPDFFATHVVLAFSARGRGDDARAEALIRRARELVRPEHPFAYIMPSAAEWACEPIEPELVELVPGSIWRVAGYYSHGIVPFHEFSIATIVRLSDGELVMINPVPLSDALVSEIRALGELRYLVTPVKFHNLFVERASAQFPEARSFGVSGHKDNPPSAHIGFDGFLDDADQLFPGELEHVLIAGNEIEEYFFYHRPTRTLIVHDIFLMNLAGHDGFTFWWRLYAWVWGVHDTVALPSFQPMMWTQFRRFRASVRRVLELDVERIISGHAPWDTVPERGALRLRSALGWVADLSTLEYVLIVARFFRRQPGFLRDLIKYLVSQKLGR